MSLKPALVLALLAAPLLGAQAALASTEMAIDGVRIESAHPYRGLRGGEAWRDALIRPWASALSVYFDRLALGPSDYLIVSNGEEELIFTAADGEAFWTEPLSGGALSFTLVAAPGSSAWGVSIDRYRTEDEPDPTMSVYRRNDLVAIAKAPQEVYDERGPVARVYIDGLGYCTGFMIERDLFMTNNHCVDSQALCDGTTVEFNYEDDATGQALVAEEYACAELVETDHGYDYSVLRIEGSPGRTWGYYTLRARLPTSGEQGVIIQHPGGGRKAAAVPDNCTLLGLAAGNEADSDFKHQCDTLSGSSGSPVLTDGYTVIGLHHFGGAGVSSRSANQAVRMDKILERCQSCP